NILFVRLPWYTVCFFFNDTATTEIYTLSLHDALPIYAALVLQSLEQDPFGGGFLKRISGKYPDCATRIAQADLRRERAYQPRMGGDDPLDKVDALLERKEATLARVRRHLKLKALLQVWLFVHVPMTFALIASLAALIICVFFYW